MAETEEESGGRLAAWLNENVVRWNGEPRLEKFQGGQSNPTYRLGWAGQDFVLRRKPFGALLPKAHMIEREYHMLDALRDAPLPIPRMRGLCEDPAVLGVSFYVMDFVPGRIFWDPALLGLDPEERAAIFDSMNRTVARLHDIRPQQFGLDRFGRPDGFMGRQIALWTAQYRAAATRDIPAMDALIDWLPRNIPAAPHPAAIFHGDLRLDNMIFHPSEPRVLALLDWELATIGDPLADLAYHVMTWRIPPAMFRGLAGLDLQALGIPTEADYVADYCRRTGRDSIPDLGFYLAFGLFRVASILQGVAKRAEGGNASAADAVDLGARAGPLAQIGWETAMAC